MIDWIKTVQGIVAVIFATVVAWWNLGLRHLVFSPELAPQIARAISADPRRPPARCSAP